MRQNKRKKQYNRGTAAALIAAVCLSLTGCGDLEDLPFDLPSFSDDAESSTGSTFTLPWDEETTTASSEESAAASSSASTEGSTTVSSDAVINVPFLGTTGYAYNQLTASEQTIYQQMMESFVTRQEVTVSTLEKSDLDTVFYAVIADHPELFYLTGYVWNTYTTNDVVTKISVTGNFSIDADTAAYDQAAVDTVVESFADTVDSSATTFEKIKAAYDYIVKNTDYNTAADNNQNILSVFLSGESVCNGYAKAMQYLLYRLGIPCTLVTGTANGGGHAWDLVYADGAYYYVDPTFGDGSFTGIEMEDNWVDYDYLMITTQDIEKTHTMDDAIPLPTCTATALNYYVVEGLYLTAYGEDSVGNIIASQLDAGSGVIRLRASDSSVYSELIEHLIDRQEIYSYLRGVNAIQYSTNADLNTLVVFLTEGKDGQDMEDHPY